MNLLNAFLFLINDLKSRHIILSKLKHSLFLTVSASLQSSTLLPLLCAQLRFLGVTATCGLMRNNLQECVLHHGARMCPGARAK